ncbi:DNA mismatch repair protein MutS [Bacillus sp. AFS077874]|uniref:DNA mismatch repair protein MutS n=1 Tax=unclassified Bacillus (in: firmicutes) TaxID=185979 RepID=UPI000BEC06CA|nr:MULTISPECIES: DNA mismatch repair protein MutS [unclassified Bacillus (in: firmicutes)]PEC49683.1 DNA mismatch repair protein MutS [Bacillus sp. AFS096315]PFM79642.1 DNA mismatch repair protein MutS [Bacillus sp. AFS077874]
MATYTPMIEQYLNIKKNYQDAFLFFRLGDFYEMFFEDAIKASQVLEITLTGRAGGTEERIPMCGVPFHSAAGYIEQLVEKGYKVAICEQVEDPTVAKGVVRREVVQLITPGTQMEGRSIDEKQNHYISTLSEVTPSSYALAWIDLTTGEGNALLLSGSIEEAVLKIAATGTKEVVVNEDFSSKAIQTLEKSFSITVSFEENDRLSVEFTNVVKSIDQTSLKATAARLLNYLSRTQKRTLSHLQEIVVIHQHDFLNMDMYSMRNLELVETQRSKNKQGSLNWLLDETKTAMGGRLLKKWIQRPLVSTKQIEHRLTIVELLMENYFIREDLKELLKEVYDLERLAGKVSFGNVNARDLLQLKRSLQTIPSIIHALKSISHETIDELINQIDPCEELQMLLENAIIEDAPLSIKEGNIIKDGFHKTLEEYRFVSKNGKNWLMELEQREREITGIKSLKIGYNRIFGYFIEVTRSNISQIPEGRYERKQTLANAERFITEELKEKETMILEAEEKMIGLEYELFISIREQVKQYLSRLQTLGQVISQIDVLQSFSVVSEKNGYVRPAFTEEREYMVKNGRHPVVEKVLLGSEYIPNDTNFDVDTHQFLITGPNMAGKSTYMKQVALISILAQIGCYVPAEYAKLPIFDQIFTRIGAADDLISGQSTFMVEMLEANYAITNATEKSLILFDEIGRGTSTYDGMALAQAMIEYIHDYIGAKTLFSTHYHELTVLANQLKFLKNIHVAAKEQDGKVLFLHKIFEGAADQSYGIHVAELANLPKDVISRAKELLNDLESNNHSCLKEGIENTEKEIVTIQVPKKEIVQTTDKEDAESQLSLFDDHQPVVKEVVKNHPVIDQLKGINILELNPMEAFNLLYELQKQVKK